MPRGKVQAYSGLFGEPRQRHVLEHLARDGCMSPNPRVIHPPDQQILPVGRRCRQIGIIHGIVGEFLSETRIDERDQGPLPPCARFLLRRIGHEAGAGSRRVGKRVRRRTGQVHAIGIGEQQPIPRCLCRAQRNGIVLPRPAAGYRLRFEDAQLRVARGEPGELCRRTVAGLVVDNEYLLDFRLSGQRLNGGCDRSFLIARGHDGGNSREGIHQLTGSTKS